MSDTKMWVELRRKMENVVRERDRAHIGYYKTVHALYLYISKHHDLMMSVEHKTPIECSTNIHSIFYKKTYYFVSCLETYWMNNPQEKNYASCITKLLLKVREKYNQHYLEYYRALPGWLPLVLRSQIVSYAYPFDLSLV